MTSLFISYSRKDIEFALKLTEACKGQAWDVWIDSEGIPPTVDWWKEIEKGIQEAGVFVFLISPDSARSKVCKQEIEHAVKNGKRLIPIVVRDVSGEESPSELRHLNWIFFREKDDFDLAFRKLTTAIQTDYEWVQLHRELQVKALEWQRSNYENSFVLRGKELQDAELQLAVNSSKEPNPTDLQREYVLRSKQASERQRRMTMGIAVVVAIVMTGLAVVAFVLAGAARNAEAAAISNASIAETQRANAITEANGRATAQADAVANQKMAEERARIARAGELAAQSVSLFDKDFLLSWLLGVEAFKTYSTKQTRSQLMVIAQANPRLQGYLRARAGDVLYCLQPRRKDTGFGQC
jgi:hypothetical protein